ncbi:hypothetical protein SIN09_31460, partial [Streptomyces sp. F8]|nr:hypothetical protein [Streptomyces sp. F8]
MDLIRTGLIRTGLIRTGLIPAPRVALLDGDGRRFAFGPEPLFDAGPGTGSVARWLRRELGAATGWSLPAAGPGAGAGAAA